MALLNGTNIGKDFFLPYCNLGSRVEVYEGKVFSSLEPYFRFRFFKVQVSLVSKDILMMYQNG